LLLFTAIDNSIGLFNRYLSYADFVLIAGIIFVLRGQAGAGFLFVFIISFIHDLLLFPNAGYTLFPRFAAIIFVKFMHDNLFHENFASKFFIMAAGLAAREILYVLAVWIFYWNFKIYFFSWRTVTRAVFSVAFGLAASGLLGPGANIRPRLKKVFK